MDVPIFDLPANLPRKPRRGTACGQAGRRGRWLGWALKAQPALAERVPVCNRIAGHEGPHRYYDKEARVRAEW